MRRAFEVVVLLIGVIPLLSIKVAYAVPAFARREGVQCQMCHYRVPEIKEDGHAYLRRGLREAPSGMKDATDMKDMPGMEAENKELPAAAMPRALGEPLPLQWRDYLTIMGHHTFNLQRHERADFGAGMVDVWAGGPFDPHWSAIVNIALDIEQGGVDIEQAYGQFITAWSDRFASVRFGQLLPFAVLFNEGGPSMELTDPIVLSTPVEAGNAWTPSTLIRGVELGAVDLPRGSAYVGAGQPHAEGGIGNDKHVDIYGTAEYLLNGDGTSIAAYGYWGKARPSAGGTAGRFHRAGLFANAYSHGVKGVAAYLWGSNDIADQCSLDNSGYFLLVEQLLGDRLAAYARYDHFWRDLAMTSSKTMEGPTIALTWWAETAVRLTIEAQFLRTTGEHRDRTVVTEFMWVF